ncbi:hypothetical protein KCP76_09830 [Salmonella enterica subsp. enterica serovar Weltevreden]|nr:hypothetical protein KCP76_09830 [Salmonella enterica subsp. enterica serovar Weltevreden]
MTSFRSAGCWLNFSPSAPYPPLQRLWRRFDPVTEGDGRCRFAIFYSLFAIRLTPSINHHHICFAGGLRRAQCAQRSFIVLGEGSYEHPDARSAGLHDVQTLSTVEIVASWLARTIEFVSGCRLLETFAARSRAADVPAMPCSSITLAPSPAFSRYSRQLDLTAQRYQTRYG